MNLKFIKRGIILATLTSSILVPVCQVQAADAVSLMTVPQQNKVVVFPHSNEKIGDFIRVRITEASSATLKGERIAD